MATVRYAPRTDNQVNINLIVGFLIILFPALIVGLSGEDGLRGSMSSYYYTDSKWIFLLGMIFIGGFLICYRGYEPKDTDDKNWDKILSNIAGLFAILAGILPTADENIEPNIPNILHILFAAALYVLVGAIQFFQFTRSDKEKKAKKKMRDFFYRLSAGLMWLSVAVIFINSVFSLEISENWTFIWEYVANTAFAFAWMTKAGGTFWLNDDPIQDWKDGERFGVIAFFVYLTITIYMIWRITSAVV